MKKKVMGSQREQESTIQEELKEWAKKVLEKYDKIAEDVNMSYYTQSNLSIIKRSPKVLILGINPGSTGAYKKISAETFLKGNKFFSASVKWHIWTGLIKIFKAGGIQDILENEEEFVFSNIFHFDTHKAKDLSNKIKNNPELVELSEELIKKLTPKMVICLGMKDCMAKIIKSPQQLINGELSYGTIDEIPVYGIPHTSKYYTNEECMMIGRVLASLYKGEVKPEKSEISNRFKEVIDAFLKRKKQIKPENILNTMIEDAFIRYGGLDMKDDKWYKISDNFIVRVTNVGGGEVIIRESKYKNGYNYLKEPIRNQDQIIEHLKNVGYELKNDGARKTSLGHKPFNKYEEWKKGPQYVVLAILKEIDELGPKLEDLYDKNHL